MRGIEEFITRFVLFLGKCVRFGAYAFLWILLIINLQHQSMGATKTSDPGTFALFLLYAILDFAGLIALAVIFFFSHIQKKTYHTWIVVGIIFLFLALLIPALPQYLFSLLKFS